MKNENNNPDLLIQTTVKKVDSASVGELKIHGRSIQIPSFIHEVEGTEDAYGIFTYQNLLKEPHIIALPVHRWAKYIGGFTRPYPEERKKLVFSLYKNHHVVLYEAPELFHYTMPFKLLKHGLAVTGRSTKEFNKLMMQENNKQEALSLLPEFESLFIDELWQHLRYKTYKKWEKQKLKCFSKVEKIPNSPEHGPHMNRAWSITEKQAYGKHVLTIINESSKLPSSSFIPAVKPLLSSSDKLDRESVAAQNKQIIVLYKKYHPNHDTGRPWLHLYLSHTIFTESGNTNIHNIIDEVVCASIDSDKNNGHAGICVTITDWDKAWQSGTPRQNLEGFIMDLGGIANSYNMPLYLARAKWIGQYLIDFGASLTGCILNGHTKTLPEGGGFQMDDPRRFGKVPLYGYCHEALINELFKEGKKPSELVNPKKLHHFEGIPDHCNIDFQHNDVRFRCDFSKPRRIATHCSEMRQIRSDLLAGKPKPGSNYIQRSYIWKGVKQD